MSLISYTTLQDAGQASPSDTFLYWDNAKSVLAAGEHIHEHTRYDVLCPMHRRLQLMAVDYDGDRTLLKSPLPVITPDFTGDGKVRGYGRYTHSQSLDGMTQTGPTTFEWTYYLPDRATVTASDWLAGYGHLVPTPYQLPATFPSGESAVGLLEVSPIAPTPPLMYWFWQATDGVPTTIPAHAGSGAAVAEQNLFLPDEGPGYVVFAQPADLGDITAIILGGSNQIGGFTKGSTTFTYNSVAYEYWISNNNLSASLYTFPFTIERPAVDPPDPEDGLSLRVGEMVLAGKVLCHVVYRTGAGPHILPVPNVDYEFVANAAVQRIVMPPDLEEAAIALAKRFSLLSAQPGAAIGGPLLNQPQTPMLNYGLTRTLNAYRRPAWFNET